MLDAIDLHDAQLKTLNIDYVARKATVEVDFYEDQENSRKRIAARINFSGIDSISHVADLNQLETNFAAGNITNWWPDVARKTYVYLAGGCLIIEANGVEFERIEAK